MLQKLRIEHLVLVDFCEISLGKGFHVITGETGSGKSVLLTAIGLLLGEKTEASAIRQGEKMAVIEGEFDLPKSIHSLLAEAEISLEGDTCTLRREILSTGKTRAFIDGHLIPIGFLKRLGNSLIEIADQHASLTLKDPQTPRCFVDQFGRCESLVHQFQELYHRLQDLLTKKELLISKEPSRESEIAFLKAQIEEIKKSDVLNVDDNALFSRLQELEHSRETFDIASAILSEIESGKFPLQSTIFRIVQRAEKLSSLASSFSTVLDLLNTACTSVREAGNELQRQVLSFDHSEEERSRLDTQLKLIDAVKRRYGASVDEIRSAKEKMENQLFNLENRDLEIERLTQEIEGTEKELATLSATLTKKRLSSANSLQPLIQDRLRLLNMPKAVFEISVAPSSRTASGDDGIRFFFTPNLGEKRFDVNEGASGGELARLFLAIQAEFADLFSIPTLLFDEVDASIGGMTANAVGKTLSSIGKKRQVLAVTHFAQVAAQADFHFALAKEEKEGRTVTTVQELCSQEQRDREHQRMIGSIPHERSRRSILCK